MIIPNILLFILKSPFKANEIPSSLELYFNKESSIFKIEFLLKITLIDLSIVEKLSKLILTNRQFSKNKLWIFSHKTFCSLI